MTELITAMNKVFADTSLGRKDSAKAAMCDKFIGFGTPDSSTHRYMKSAGVLANCGSYFFGDYVFVSINGKRLGAIPYSDERYMREIKLAMYVGATIVADKAGTGRGCRNSSHNNDGEGAFARFLADNDYFEINGDGIWRPKIVDIWFKSDFNCLSNLAERRFRDQDGRKYVSVEHAYQTWKSGNFDEVCFNVNWKPGAKHAGNFKANIVGNKNIVLMKALMDASFKQNPDIRDILVKSQGIVFTHNKDGGIWRNKFPEILSELRLKYLQ